MSDTPILISYNTSLNALERELAQGLQSGDYYCAGSHEISLPLLKVKAIGTVAFPFQPGQAAEVISKAAEIAPYGRGDRTLIDTNIRKVWQLGTERFTLAGKAWEHAFEKLITKVTRELGCVPGGVKAELYKLLIYDEGGHFTAHRDTEKSPGMFGTLVVSLPSAHTGGELKIRHHGREATVSLCNEDPGEVRYAAFYADCEHEVHPVTSGYRLCLVYHLVHHEGARPETPDNQEIEKKVTALLSQWATSGDAPLKLVYLLEHRYTQATIAFSTLKGADAAKADLLGKAAKKSGCELHLGILHIEESGWAEHRGGYGYYRSSYDEEEYETGEVCDGSYYIDQWRDPSDKPVAFGPIPLGDEETLPLGSLEDARPDQAHFSEATGNEGASFERTYLRAALILWPASASDEVCFSAGLDAAIARFGQLVEHALAEARPARESTHQRLSRFLRLMPGEWPRYEDHRQRLTSFLTHLAASGSSPLVLQGLRCVPMAQCYHAGANEAFLSCIGILSAASRKNICLELLPALATKDPAASLRWWILLARRFPHERKLLADTFDLLVTKSSEAKPPPDTLETFGRRFDRGGLPEETSKRPASLPLAPELLADFLRTVPMSLGEDAGLRFLKAIFANPEGFTPQAHLLPGLEQIADDGTIQPFADALWQQCAAHYLARSSIPPEPPANWTQTAPIPGAARNALLRELEQFARDPAAREHRFRVRKELRQVLHQAIDHAGLDMDHVTLRQGRPQTLVCTKTRATYQRLFERYQHDLDAMRRLLALPCAGRFKKIAGNLQKALSNAPKEGPL